MFIVRVFRVLSVVLLFSLLPLAQQAFAHNLTVEVWTDKPSYQAGEELMITVLVSYNGQLVNAAIDQGYIDITPTRAPDFTYRYFITQHFRQVRPGLFIANVRAGEAGSHQIYVSASAVIREGCCCRTLYGFAVHPFPVGPACPPGYAPCYQPPAPCPPCGAVTPDFTVRQRVRLEGTRPTRVSLALPSFVLEQLARMARQLTFREAPWERARDWARDRLSDLRLSLDPRTGEIAGELSSERIYKKDYSFLLEVLNPEGRVIATILLKLEVLIS
ncbi:MAG: hypothetical protein NUW06_00920 [Candidatus Acetothermia bacterium]|nr:hypothetical protein [Candidatus Acetothermia bacterium]